MRSAGRSAWYHGVLLAAFLNCPQSDAMYLLASTANFAQGCFQLAVGTYTKDMTATSGTSACSGSKCPPCFLLDTTSGPVQLTIQNCHQNAFSSLHSVSTLNPFRFTNAGASAATVSDNNGNIYMMTRNGMRGSSLDCNCYGSLGSGYLSCDASETAVKFTGSIPLGDYIRSDTCLVVNTDASYNVQFPMCAFKYCPPCFFFDTNSNAVTLTLSNCAYFMGMDSSSIGHIQYFFTNIGTNLAKISDGTYVYTLAAYGSGQSSTVCSCTSGNVFSCSSPTVRAAASTTGVANFPESLSVTDAVKFASSLSVRSFTKLGSFMRLNDQPLQWSTDANTYTQYSSSSLQFYVDSTRKLSMASSGGQLHGTWASDGVVTSSDARLKKEIEPLETTLSRLRGEGPPAGPTAGPTAGPRRPTRPSEATRWFLEQLRPVSYVSINDESGGRRFGFLAHELQRVAPDMVRVSNDEARTKRVYMNDLLAVLVANAQAQHQTFQAFEASCTEQQRALEGRLSQLEQAVTSLASRLDACCGQPAS